MSKRKKKKQYTNSAAPLQDGKSGDRFVEIENFPDVIPDEIKLSNRLKEKFWKTKIWEQFKLPWEDGSEPDPRAGIMNEWKFYMKIPSESLSENESVIRIAHANERVIIAKELFTKSWDRLDMSHKFNTITNNSARMWYYPKGEFFLRVIFVRIFFLRLISVNNFLSPFSFLLMYYYSMEAFIPPSLVGLNLVYGCVRFGYELNGNSLDKLNSFDFRVIGGHGDVKSVAACKKRRLRYESFLRLCLRGAFFYHHTHDSEKLPPGAVQSVWQQYNPPPDSTINSKPFRATNCSQLNNTRYVRLIFGLAWNISCGHTLIPTAIEKCNYNNDMYDDLNRNGKPISNHKRENYRVMKEAIYHNVKEIHKLFISCK